MKTKTRNELRLSNGMVVTEETIDPDKAAIYLEHNDTNRMLSKTHVNYLSHIIKSGNWSLTHQGIAFDVEGNLLDGQHRLQAIIHSGMEVPVLVFRATIVSDRTKIDYGRVRTINDIFKMEGLTNAQYRASTYRMVLNYARGDYAHKGKINPNLAFQIHDAIGEEVDQVIGIMLAAPNCLRKAAPIAAATAILLSCTPEEEEDFLNFLSRIKTGIGLDHGDPELCWRDWYYRSLSMGLQAVVLNNTLMCFLKRAWDYHQEGKKTKKLVVHKQTKMLDDLYTPVRKYLQETVNMPPLDSALQQRLEEKK